MSDVKRVKISDLKPDSRNANKGTERGVYMLTESLRQYGAGRSILVDRDGNVIAGNKTLERAADLGFEDVIVVPTDGRTLVAVQREDLDLYDGDEARLLAYYDNRTSEVDLAWEAEQLLADQAAGVDLSGLWHEDELAELLGMELPEEADAEPQVNRAEELREQWGVKPGQLWRLPSRVEGQEHRLVCGDCTDASVVERVMGGERAALCFTSPPYLQQRDYTDASDVSDWDALMCGVFEQLPMTDDGQVLVNLGLVHRDYEWWPYWEGWIEWMRAQGWLRFGWYVWDKLCGLPGDHGGRLAPAHEFVFHFCRKPVKPSKNIPTKNAGRVVRGHNRQKDGSLTKQTGWGDAVQDYRIQDSVFRAGAEKGAHGIDHPAVMSHNFAELAVNSYPGDVYDPFLGSGTTIIACENLSRQCRAIEIAAPYVAVALQRYLDAFGITPELVG